MSSKYRTMLLVSGGVLVLDQLTKYWIHTAMALYQSIELVANFVHLTYLRNTGVAFGFLAGAPSPLRMAFFTLISAVAVGCIVYLLKNLRSNQTAMVVSLSMVLGGALGNLIDRLLMGEVIDFIDLHWYHIHWPAFNVADSAITIGVLLLLWQMVRKRSWT